MTEGAKGFNLQEHGDELLRQMQEPKVREGIRKAFDANPEDFEAIVAAAKDSSASEETTE